MNALGFVLVLFVLFLLAYGGAFLKRSLRGDPFTWWLFVDCLSDVVHLFDWD